MLHLLVDMNDIAVSSLLFPPFAVLPFYCNFRPASCIPFVQRGQHAIAEKKAVQKR